jgi:AraC-like DNA-binding protein
VRGLLTAFARLGHDVPALVAAAGLAATAFDDPDARIAAETVGAVFGAAQARRPLRNLDLRLAEETPLGAFPLIDYLIVTASTVGEGMRRFARYAILTGAPIRVLLQEDERPIRVVFEMDCGSPQYSVAMTVLHLRREAPGLRAELASFTDAVEDEAAYETTLGCPVRANASWSGFALSARAWSLPLRRRDPALQSVLERHAADVLARIPADGDLVSDLRRTLAKRVTSGDTRLSMVAREVGASTRTVQRRLAEAGLTYQAMLDQSRCEAALRHLRDGSLSIAEISCLVGYSEPSAFHRAFKRWQGRSPQAYRREPRG